MENVYQKILLGDIAVRYGVRNAQVLRVLMKKLAETVCSEVSFSKLCNAVNAAGLKISKDAVISYVGYALDAYLIFRSVNFISKFAEREVGSLTALANDGSTYTKEYLIVTFEDDERIIEARTDIRIRVLPLYKFLLDK